MQQETRRQVTAGVDLAVQGTGTDIPVFLFTVFSWLQDGYCCSDHHIPVQGLKKGEQAHYQQHVNPFTEKVKAFQNLLKASA